MRVPRFWRRGLSPLIPLVSLILVFSLAGVHRGLGAETAAPKPSPPAPAAAPALTALPPLVCPVPAPPAPLPPPEHTLHSLKIVGAKIVKVKDLKKELSMKQPFFWLPWRKPPPFRYQDLEYDVEHLKIYYQRQGFFHTEITPEVNYLPDNKVDVTLKVKEGPWVKVTEVDVEVAGQVDLSDLKDKWPLKPGDRYADKRYDDLKNLYLNYLPNHGYPRVRVRGRVFLNQEKNTAKILLHINPGSLSYFGEVHIKDLEKLETPAAVILEKVTFQPGQVFNLDELFKTQRKLYATDLFRSVVLTPETVPPQEPTIPIAIEIEEKKKHSLRVGLGYGDEDKVRARLGVRFRNLGGGGRLLDLGARYSTLGYLISELFSNPCVFGSTFDFVNESGARRRNLPGFNDRAYFTQARLERDISWETRLIFGYGLEIARPFDIPVETLLLLQGTQPEKMYRASFALLGLRRDTTDSHIGPRRGGIISWNNQFGPSFLGSDMQFVQSVIDLRRYHALFDSNFVLAGRAQFGFIQPIQFTRQIPISRLFFSGGADSVRGYQLDYLGPRNPSNNPIGGEALTVLSIEGRFPLPIYEKIGGVIFLDAGNVFLKIHDFDLGQLKYSPGFGLRYLSPIGAIGLDIAFPTNRINYEQDSRYQIHFSVGYGF